MTRLSSTQLEPLSVEDLSDPGDQRGCVGQGVQFFFWWVLWPVMKWMVIAALPFGALLRGTLHAYEQQWPLPLAMLAGFLAAFVVLFLYVSWVYLRFKSAESAYRFRTFRTKAIGVLLVLAVFQGYVLLAPDASHVKSDEVHAEYVDLHPILRMSIATFLLVDDSLLMTDLSRHPSDYKAMGLSVNPRSLHYPQPSGYVHAFDVRTKGHSGVRNMLMEAYFAALGFRTLRHTGTADHLHVALPPAGG